MRGLVAFDFGNLGTPRAGAPAPERVLEGNPTHLTWDVDQTADGKVKTGVWEVTPGKYRSMKGGTWEICTILSGVSELTEDGQQPIRMEAGDTFIMRPGFTGIWHVIETTRKLWVTYA